MSTDRISGTPARKRKAAEAAGFPSALKPIKTAPPNCKPRLLSTDKSAEDDSLVDLDIGNNHNGDANNYVEGNDGLETPKGEEHQIPTNLACPPAPRKPRSTTKRKGGDYFLVTPRELKFVFNPSQPKQFRGQLKV